MPGARAQYKGSGTINGAGDYGFMLTAIDEKLTPSTSVDLFRIKIWDKVSNALAYDNQLGKDEFGDDATALGGRQHCHPLPPLEEKTRNGI